MNSYTLDPRLKHMLQSFSQDLTSHEYFGNESLIQKENLLSHDVRQPLFVTSNARIQLIIRSLYHERFMKAVHRE